MHVGQVSSPGGLRVLRPLGKRVCFIFWIRREVGQGTAQAPGGSKMKCEGSEEAEVKCKRIFWKKTLALVFKKVPLSQDAGQW